MATHNVTAGQRGTGLVTLVASTADTNNFAEDMPECEVINPASNSDAVWYTNDGTTPTVGGQNCFYVPAGGVDAREPVKQDGANKVVIKVISSGTPTIRVQRGV